MTPRRVVVTGVGAVTGLGFGPEDHVPALREGRSAVGPVTRFETAGFRTAAGAQCDENALAARLKGHDLRSLGVDTRMLLWATAEALRGSGLRPSGPLPAVLGTTLEGLWGGEQWFLEVLRRGAEHARPRRLMQTTAGAQFATLAERLDLPLEPLCVSNACATGVSAIGRLYRRLRSGAVEAGLAGGYDTLTRFIHLGFDSLGALTPRTCAPFDRDRSGFFLGDGAAVFVLETLESARRRGARIRAEILGYGESVDSHHPTHPHPEGRGIARAIRQALDAGGCAPEDVDYINAHGTGTPANDAAEARGILAALGEAGRRVPVSSTKPLVGHTLGAAGAVEQAFCVFALEGGFRPLQVNLSTPDPACDLTFVRDPEGAPPRTTLNTSLGFGGANGVLLTRRWEGGP